jgi:DNA-binding response OmpR family regulator
VSVRALIVDDDPAVAEMVRAILASAGMQAETITDSRQAATRLPAERFDIVLLDVHMPPPNGIELARRMRAAGYNQDTPLVMMTGEDDLTLQRQAFAAGANFFLFKPIDRQRVLRVIRATQDSVQHERRRFQRVVVSCRVSLSNGMETVDGMTLDLSLGGMMVKASSTLPKDSMVKVILYPGAAGPLQAQGRVVRVLDENRMGLRLMGMNQENSERLQEFLLPLILSRLDWGAAELPRV